MVNEQLTTEEHWKPIEGWEGIYEVSNWGRVKSLKREAHIIRQGYPQIIYVKEKILKPRYTGDKYLCVGLSRGKGKTFTVHPLVAKAFLKKPITIEKLCVNHINGIKSDNSVNNLEWVTQKENIQHSVRTGLKVISQKFLKSISERKSKATLDLETGIYYDSVKLAAESVGLTTGTVYQRISKSKNKRFILI